MRAPFPELPPGFRLGTATSAYQSEGSPEADGRGPSIWDTFTARPGTVLDATSGDPASDSYRRHRDDVALMARLGGGGHRFSISWSRVLPTGRGPVNAAGLDFYDRLVDEMLAHGVAPMAALYHWDLPQALEDDGGWLNRDTVEAFAEYAGVVGERLADRVEHWIPVVEPNVATIMGHATGLHAPGREMGFDSLLVAHHLLLAHGRAVIELRTAGASSIGCANNHAPMWPVSEDPADVGATKLFDALWNGLFLEPMLLGRYPVDLAPLVEEAVRPGDLATIRQPLDFYGVNYYSPIKIGAAPEDSPIPFEICELVGYPVTDIGWPVVPDALREWLITLRARFRAALPPLVVTESGAAYTTPADESGAIDDQQRIDYLDAHLRAVGEACRRGVDVRGYYVWSLLDSFEWVHGHTQQYGLVHVDRLTGARTPKASFEWYAALIAAQPRSIG